MPTYVYECKKCLKVFEIVQKMTEDALTDCASCGEKGSLRRLIQPVAVSFKGSGFHINDYATTANPGAGSSEPAKVSETSSEKPSSPETSIAKESASPATAPSAESTEAAEGANPAVKPD